MKPFNKGHLQMNKVITLSDFLRRVNIQTVADKLGVTRQSVYYWQQMHSFPRPEKALKLIELSMGSLTWESIYLPYVEYNFPEQLELL